MHFDGFHLTVNGILLLAKRFSASEDQPVMQEGAEVGAYLGPEVGAG
jgi:hypothetical protein